MDVRGGAAHFPRGSLRVGVIINQTAIIAEAIVGKIIVGRKGWMSLTSTSYESRIYINAVLLQSLSERMFPMRNWRKDPITEKQEQMIANMEETACMNDAFIPPFSGSTKGEAYDYISNYLSACYQSAYNPHEDAGDRI